MEQYDVVIIGAGPGGYVAAIHAGQKGLNVALVEGREPGGVCLHAGCIPTKAMLASVDVLRQSRSAAQYGLAIPQAEASLAAINSRRQKVVQQLAQGVKFLLQKNGVEWIPGWGWFKSAGAIEVRDGSGQPTRVFENPRAVIIATGSRPAELPGLPVDHQFVLNSNDVLNLTDTPAELLILGGGYIGCEFASVFAPLGSRVTLIEALPRLLPNMDPDLGQALERSFKKSGIQVLLNARVEKVQNGPKVQVTLNNEQVLTGDKLLVSVGRVPNVEKLGLENAGVNFSPRGIEVDDQLHTTAPNVYAIGDVTGKMALAHVASAQARRVADLLAAQLKSASAAPKTSGINYDAVPVCVFTHPEIAAVGLSEPEARQRGLNIRVSKFPFMASGKALAAGETEGFVKLIADAESGKLIGAHILGAHASELIATAALAVQCGLTVDQITATIFAHPTLGEAIHEAAEGVFGKPTHLSTGR